MRRIDKIIAALDRNGVNLLVINKETKKEGEK